MSVFDAATNALYRLAMWVGSVWCHQLPERSPHLFGAQGPLCWRCSGIAVGAGLLLVYLFVRRRLPAFAASLALALLLPLDVIAFWLGHDDYANARRVVTGVLWGFGAAGGALRLAAVLFDRQARSAKGSSKAFLTPPARPADAP